MPNKGFEVTEVLCTGFGYPAEDEAYISITRKDRTTERFKLTPSIVAFLSHEFSHLNYKWNTPDAA